MQCKVNLQVYIWGNATTAFHTLMFFFSKWKRNYFVTSPKRKSLGSLLSKCEKAFFNLFSDLSCLFVEVKWHRKKSLLCSANMFFFSISRKKLQKTAAFCLSCKINCSVSSCGKVQRKKSKHRKKLSSECKKEIRNFIVWLQKKYM